MDNKKLIKQFIVEMSYWFEYKLRTERHTNFLYELNNEMAWLVADKAIDIRIRNRLLKEYGIKAEVTYELKTSANLYPAGELRITYRPDPLDFKLRMEEDHKYTSL